MSTKTIALLIGVILSLINGIDSLLACLKNHWPGVEPFNSTHIKVGWTEGDGSGFRYCDDSQQHIDFEKYEITQDGRSLGEQDSVKEEYSAVIVADPCLKHDVAIKFRVSDAYSGREVWRSTKTAHYNNIDEPEALFSNLLKEGIKLMCKVDNTIQLRPLPNDVREKCIKRIVHDKEKGSVFLEIIKPSGKRQDETVCVKGKSDQQELQHCNVGFPITIEVSRKSEVDQTLEIVSNENCFGEDKADNLTKNTSLGKEESAQRKFVLKTLFDLLSTIS